MTGVVVFIDSLDAHDEQEMTDCSGKQVISGNEKANATTPQQTLSTTAFVKLCEKHGASSTQRRALARSLSGASTVEVYANCVTLIFPCVREKDMLARDLAELPPGVLRSVANEIGALNETDLFVAISSTP